MNKLKGMCNEYSRRITKARQLMKEQRLEALFLTGGSNLVYFTRASGFLAGPNGSRPSIFLLPLNSDPVLIVHDGFSRLARETVITDIRTYSRLSHLPDDALLEAMKDKFILEGRIGAEFGSEMSLNLPYGEFMEFQGKVSQVEWVDASPLLWELRRIKSEA